jgi:hypothetical protein
MAANEDTVEYKATVEWIRKLAATHGLGWATHAFAAAVAEGRLMRFMLHQHVTPSLDEHVCVYRLVGEKCIGAGCNSPQFIPGIQFPSEWIKDGKTECIIGQPYGLTYPELRALVGFCEEFSLEATISAGWAWHYAGRGLAIAYSPIARQWAREDR